MSNRDVIALWATEVAEGDDSLMYAVQSTTDQTDMQFLFEAVSSSLVTKCRIHFHKKFGVDFFDDSMRGASWDWETGEIHYASPDGHVDVQADEIRHVDVQTGKRHCENEYFVETVIRLLYGNTFAIYIAIGLLSAVWIGVVCLLLRR